MKKLLYILLTFLIQLLFLYFLLVFYFYISIGNNFKNDFFTNKKKLNFYKTHSEIVNHVRYIAGSGKPMIIENSKLHEMIYTVINKSKNGNTILFQGDSWIQQITDSKKNSNYLKKSLGPNFTVIGAGTTSYSPSLMSLQFKLLEEKFDIKPDFLIAFIDQSDIGDENCRYKNLKKFDIDGNLNAVTYEKYPIFTGPFNIDRIIKFSEIALIDKSKIYKVQKYTNYQIVKSFNRIVKMTNYKVNKVSISQKCHWEQIEKNLISPHKEDIEYFKDSLREYFIRISSSNKLQKIYVVTHPLYKHISGEYKVNISDIVDDVSNEFPKINHINFTKIIKENNNFYLDAKNIWSTHNVHLKNEIFREKFIKKIVQYFKTSLKN